MTNQKDKFVIAKNDEGKWVMEFPGRETRAIMNSHADCIAVIRDTQLWEASLKLKSLQRQITTTVDRIARLSRGRGLP